MKAGQGDPQGTAAVQEEKGSACTKDTGPDSEGKVQ
jgi:hypothetical protein